jgi:hypothetical protein
MFTELGRVMDNMFNEERSMQVMFALRTLALQVAGAFQEPMLSHRLMVMWRAFRQKLKALKWLPGSSFHGLAHLPQLRVRMGRATLAKASAQSDEPELALA